MVDQRQRFFKFLFSRPSCDVGDELLFKFMEPSDLTVVIMKLPIQLLKSSIRNDADALGLGQQCSFNAEERERNIVYTERVLRDAVRLVPHKGQWKTRWFLNAWKINQREFLALDADGFSLYEDDYLKQRLSKYTVFSTLRHMATPVMFSWGRAPGVVPEKDTIYLTLHNYLGGGLSSSSITKLESGKNGEFQRTNIQLWMQHVGAPSRGPSEWHTPTLLKRREWHTPIFHADTLDATTLRNMVLLHRPTSSLPPKRDASDVARIIVVDGNDPTSVLPWLPLITDQGLVVVVQSTGFEFQGIRERLLQALDTVAQLSNVSGDFSARFLAYGRGSSCPAIVDVIYEYPEYFAKVVLEDPTGPLVVRRPRGDSNMPTKPWPLTEYPPVVTTFTKANHRSMVAAVEYVGELQAQLTNADQFDRAILLAATQPSVKALSQYRTTDMIHADFKAFFMAPFDAADGTAIDLFRDSRGNAVSRLKSPESTLSIDAVTVSKLAGMFLLFGWAAHVGGGL
eukprot:GHVQ01036217.1.p1 GENE.GHVQ01036217.1~~GHVQ01036217.1.p1  ORF type:complete len:511 (+),score=56.04 GHVQ01036217.1:1749-3281(+)